MKEDVIKKVEKEAASLSKMMEEYFLSDKPSKYDDYNIAIKKVGELAKQI